MPRDPAQLIRRRTVRAGTSFWVRVFAAGAMMMPAAVFAADGLPAGSAGQEIWAIVAVLAAALIAAIGWGLSVRRRMSLLENLFDGLRTPRLVTRIDGSEIAATASWRALLEGMEGSLDTLRRRVAETGDDAAAKFERLMAAANDGKPAQEDFHLRWDGIEYGRISVETSIADGGRVYWRILDVSEHHLLEREIRSEQEKLIEFVENAPIGFYSVDRDGRFRYANPTFAEWVGKSEQELTGGDVRLHDLLAATSAEGCKAHTPLARQDGDALGETAFVDGSGDAFDAYITQTVVADEKSGDLRTRTLVRHLSAEKKFADAMRVSQERFHRFFEDAPVGIVLLDSDGRITECNHVFGRTIETDCGEAVGRPFAEFVKSEDRDQFQGWISSAYNADEGPAPIEVELGDTGDVAVSLYAAHAENADGEGTGLIVHAFDMSEQKRIEAQFFQSQKMELVGQLAGGIAHDFNNLLTAMIGFCDLLLLRHTPRDQSFADIQQIKQNANRAANLVRQLLAFSRQQTLQPKVLDMTEVLSETSYLLRRLIGAGIELKFYHGRDLWLMTADQGQFEQVVIKFGRECARRDDRQRYADHTHQQRLRGGSPVGELQGHPGRRLRAA